MTTHASSGAAFPVGFPHHCPLLTAAAQAAIAQGRTRPAGGARLKWAAQPPTLPPPPGGEARGDSRAPCGRGCARGKRGPHGLGPRWGLAPLRRAARQPAGAKPRRIAKKASPPPGGGWLRRIPCSAPKHSCRHWRRRGCAGHGDGRAAPGGPHGLGRRGPRHRRGEGTPGGGPAAPSDTPQGSTPAPTGAECTRRRWGVAALLAPRPPYT